MRRLLAVGQVAALALALGSCGIPNDAQPRALDSRAAPFTSLAEEATPQPTGSAQAVVFLVNQGVLVAVPRRLERVAAGALLGALVAGPTERERVAGFSTAVPPGVRLTGEPARGGVVRVELPGGDVGTGARTDEVQGLGQLVLTLTRLPGVRGVQLVRDGEVLAVPRGDGSLTAAVLTRADYAALI